LHQYLDIVQIHVQNLAGAIGRAFFRDWRPDAPVKPDSAQIDPQPAAAQSQSQSSAPAAKPPASAGGKTEAAA
jgi:hypothetical protein